MPAGFYNNVSGTTSGTPGTGAFTPNAAASGARAWSTVPTGWIGLVYYQDGTAWELSYSYWNGTTLSRASTQFYDSSTGSALSLTSAATASLVIDAGEVMTHLGGHWRGWFTAANSTTIATVGLPSTSVQGTAAATTCTTTNYLTEQPRLQITSLTTVNSPAGIVVSGGSQFVSVNTNAGRGGFEFTARFGASALPTGPRLFAGLTQTNLYGLATEPSASTGSIAGFSLDSTDTNIQLLVGATGNASVKTATTIPLVANGWYEAVIWMDPGSTKVWGLLMRLDTGAIWLGSTSTGTPTTAGNAMSPQVFGSLNNTNTGTAIVMNIGHMVLRGGL